MPRSSLSGLLVLGLGQPESLRELGHGHSVLQQLLEDGREVLEELALVLGVCRSGVSIEGSGKEGEDRFGSANRVLTLLSERAELLVGNKSVVGKEL